VLQENATTRRADAANPLAACPTGALRVVYLLKPRK